jgi:phage gpG-like protein
MALWEIELDFPQFKNVAVQIQSELPGLIAATLQTQRAMIFDSSGTYNGRPGWDPLKCRDGQPLKDRGTLSQSIGPANDGITPGRATGSIVQLAMGMVTIGTNIAYAEVHDQGKVIVPVKAKALRFKCHGKFVFRKKVTIPARPFGNFTSDDISELNETVTNYLTSKING